MRNRVGILILIIALVLYSIYKLSFTFVSRNVQSRATQYATLKDGKVDERRKQTYLDSIWREPVYNMGIAKYTYKEVKRAEIKLGLDLQGGMHVVMEVSPVEIIRALSGNSTDPTFQQALRQARAEQLRNPRNFTDLFYRQFQALAPGRKLSSIFSNSLNKGKINFQSTDGEVLRFINKEVEESVERSLQILRTRIDQFGVVQPNIQRLGNSSRIQVELPGVDNPERVRKLLSGVAKLEFYEVYNPIDFFPYWQQWDKLLTAREKLNAKDENATGKDPKNSKDLARLLSDTTAQTTVKADTTAQPGDTNDLAKQLTNQNVKKTDSAGKAKADTSKNPLENSVLAKLLPIGRQGMLARVQDTARINRYLEDPTVRALFPANIRFAWEKPNTDKLGKDNKDQYVTFYVLRRSTDGKAALEGDVITSAKGDFEASSNGGSRGYQVSMTMNPTGARKWKKLTGQNVGKQIAIVLDNVVYSAPSVNGEIPNGSSVITGNFDKEEADDLANVLKAGRLPAPAQIVEEVVVGPTLGRESIQQGLITVAVAFATIILFMLLYYNTSGLIADIAVLFNLVLIVAIMADLGSVLTLPGIAGIVLTVGMAVDANVLLNERIKEELRAGQTMEVALRNGYGAATVTILDANITVALAGIVLLLFGSGPVQGFATTLLLGIVTSLFTSVLVTRFIAEWALTRQFSFKFTTALTKNLFVGFAYDFISKRKIAYVASAVFLLAGLVSAFVRGFDYGVDFKGGWSYIVRFDKPVETTQVRTALAGPLNGEPEVKSFGSADKLKITTTYLIESGDEKAATQVQQKVEQGLKKTGVSYEIQGVSKIGPTIADDIRAKSIWSVLVALSLIFGYIWIRFRRWEYAMGATIATLHDALVAVAVFTLFKGFLPFPMEVDQNFIAAVLTIAGYSVNDTVVIFDRIRENLRHTSNADKVEDVVNRALNETFSRSVVTAFTVLLVVALLLAFGGQSLRGMSLALLIGVVSGSYSTLFIAVPFLVDVVKQDLVTQAVADSAALTARKEKTPATRS